MSASTSPSSVSALSQEDRLALLEEKNADLVKRIRVLSEETRAQEQLIRTLFDFTPFGLAIFNSERQLVQVNKAGQTLLQKDRTSLIGKPCNVIFACEALIAEHCSVLDGNTMDKLETHCPESLKNSRTFLRSAVNTATDKGSVIIEAFVDISEIKQADRAKDDFLAKMSHELRTPLNAISGFTELLRDELSDDDTSVSHDYLTVMKNASDDLEHIIDELMDVAKIRGNKINLDMHIVGVAELIGQIEHEVWQNSAFKDRLQIEIDVKTVYADPKRLKQILAHLLENAFKYGNDSPVQLQIGNNSSHTIFVVSDHGPGMSEEQQQRVFNEFEQGDNSITRQFGGIGLGLSIANHFAQLMGGELKIKSQLKQGTQVSLLLPIREA